MILMVDLFSNQEKKDLLKSAPLALRLRPRTLDEFVGQGHFIGKGKLLRRMIEADRLTSVIFYGPPGTGKTSLAEIIANITSAEFVHINATNATVKDLRSVLDRAKARLLNSGNRTVLFIDEIHRFNRAQQDVLLSDVEQGTIILIGATTENPFFAINSPLISRSQIFRFEPLSDDDIRRLILRAVSDKERGFGKYNIKITDDAVDYFIKMSDGDARRALTGLEVAVLSQLKGDKRGEVVIDIEVAKESIQEKGLVYDRAGDQHYDHISAMIKSMRGSDPDATVYWLARILAGGEDIRFVARRIAICAAEDVGLADPMALVLANAAVQVTEFVGMPEAQLILSEAAIYIACAPKSNSSAMAIWSAMDDVKNDKVVPVPIHLRDSHYKGAKKFGHGVDYKYDHSFPEGIAPQEYLGVPKRYYKPTDRGHEQRIKQYLQKVFELRKKFIRES